MSQTDQTGHAKKNSRKKNIFSTDIRHYGLRGAFPSLSSLPQRWRQPKRGRYARRRIHDPLPVPVIEPHARAQHVSFPRQKELRRVSPDKHGVRRIRCELPSRRQRPILLNVQVRVRDQKNILLAARVRPAGTTRRGEYLLRGRVRRRRRHAAA
eukprot:29282-Pelagococcus_subviridis.AAC.14